MKVPGIPSKSVITKSPRSNEPHCGPIGAITISGPIPVATTTTSRTISNIKQAPIGTPVQI